MSAGSVIGYGLLGIAPHLALFFALFLRKHFMMLVFLASGFIWLLTLLFVSVIVRGFVPVPDTAASYAGIVLFAVTVQEAVRLCFVWSHRKIIKGVDDAVREARRIPLPARGQDARCLIGVDDRFHLSLALGYGHGLCHSFFFFISMLPLARLGGTYYADKCPRMNYFLASALQTLGITLVHVYSMPLGILPLEDKQDRSRLVFVVLLHYAVALTTLANFSSAPARNRFDGCLVTTPFLIFTGLAVMVWALHEQHARRMKEIIEDTEAEVAAEEAARERERAREAAGPAAAATGSGVNGLAAAAAAAVHHRAVPAVPAVPAGSVSGSGVAVGVGNRGSAGHPGQGPDWGLRASPGPGSTEGGAGLALVSNPLSGDKVPVPAARAGPARPSGAPSNGSLNGGAAAGYLGVSVPLAGAAAQGQPAAGTARAAARGPSRSPGPSSLNGSGMPAQQPVAAPQSPFRHPAAAPGQPGHIQMQPQGTAPGSGPGAGPQVRPGSAAGPGAR